MFENSTRFYIDGEWIRPSTDATIDVIDPSTEQPFSKVAAGNAQDVSRAVAAARAAFPAFSSCSRVERLEILDRILKVYDRRSDEMARAISREIGAPITLARQSHVRGGRAHLEVTLAVLCEYEFDRQQGSSLIRREPIGVCALITPWNWPIHQIAAKVAPAIAAGCTMVLKPSEVAPLSAILFAEILHEAKVPPGVFNLVNGTGPEVGQALSAHPDVDMVSFTGSTRAGIAVAEAAAPTVKRVAQELGGKSPNILLDDCDLRSEVTTGVHKVLRNSGQTCDAPTRMLVPKDLHDQATAIARSAVEEFAIGDPQRVGTQMGPVVSAQQYDRIQTLISAGVADGAEVVVGGVGRPEGHDRGYYVKPTVFANVRAGMKIEREEIFGPVLCVIPYSDEEEAIRIANDTPYGLAAYVSSASLDRARKVAERLRAGQVFLNYAPGDLTVPFGGYKQSGNGREYGRWAIDDFTELKAVVGFAPTTMPGG
ncbi:aldehyde dehydrogenase family protein [Sinorhizobium mexicanum]|uniref:Aldehyde dehydrogenase family protein n=1 Tax=Sinorhizobium mexicanum TaxID=375549 RepID=A0A859QCW1_9HYPH|nr:aldehyde dehydrogenase family protein [Sinorhizobium mexicanum]MBP1881754.1 aldehyde dehydrogenase (NAD+) [Sinorhizobium mexicanum]QLL61512.1 aldehyde dehydrogenase family protein [Sinorhizobium mexicanum]